jgi:hypothetical protein
MENIIFIVDSKTFRKFLKEIIKKYAFNSVGAEYTFSIENNELIVGEYLLEVHTNQNSLQNEIELLSVKKMVKVLKVAKQQPIKVELTDQGFNLNCVF